MDAVALLKIPHDALRAALDASKAPRTAALEDGSLLFTKLPFDAEPEELMAGLRTILGPALALHQEPRGFFVLPDVAKPQGKTYASVLDEVGELGLWVSRELPAPSAKPVVAPAPAATTKPKEQAVSGKVIPMTRAPVQDDDDDDMDNDPLAAFAAQGLDLGALASQMQGLLSQLPPEFMEQVGRAMESGDLSQLEHLAPSLEKAMESQGGVDVFQAQMQNMLSAQGMSVEQLQQMMGMPQDPQDAQSMLREAEAELERMRKLDPSKLAALEAQLGIKVPKGK